MRLNDVAATTLASDSKSSVRGCNEVLEGIEEFYWNLWLLKEFKDFYERHPTTTGRDILDRTLAKLGEMEKAPRDETRA